MLAKEAPFIEFKHFLYHYLIEIQGESKSKKKHGSSFSTL